MTSSKEAQQNKDHSELKQESGQNRQVVLCCPYSFITHASIVSITESIFAAKAFSI